MILLSAWYDLVLFFSKIPYELSLLANSINLSTISSIWIYLGSFIFIIFFYIVNTVLLLKNGGIYYDKAFKITYLSTIDEVNEKKRRHR